jgi:hypothetical protein
MNELINMLTAMLENQPDCQYLEVYSSFDALPVSSKSKKLFLVITPECFCLNTAFPDGNAGGLAPFTADLKFSLLAPALTPSDKLLEFFYSVLMPKLHTANCFLYEMQAEAPKTDYRLQKLVYAGKFRIKGIYAPNREESP